MTQPTTQPMKSPEAPEARRNADPSTAGGSPGTAGANSASPPKRRLPKTVVCPVSGTVFNPRATGGRCPVCGEQVVPEEQLGGVTSLARSGSQWLGQGGWRLVALIAFILYQLGIFAALWVHLADIHAF